MQFDIGSSLDGWDYGDYIITYVVGLENETDGELQAKYAQNKGVQTVTVKVQEPCTSGVSTGTPHSNMPITDHGSFYAAEYYLEASVPLRWSFEGANNGNCEWT